jgi:hypothetical protein
MVPVRFILERVSLVNAVQFVSKSVSSASCKECCEPDISLNSRVCKGEAVSICRYAVMFTNMLGKPSKITLASCG